MLELLDPVIKSHKTEISNGLNVHYLEANLNNSKNPTALLLHGFPELSFSWRKIIPELAKKGFRVIAPDMRGYGLTIGGKKEFNTDISEYRLLNLSTDIISLLSSLNIDKINLLVGHDAGSSVAAVSALIRPDIFKSVVMMSAPYAGTPNINTSLTYKDPIHKELEKLDPPRKHYQWYYSSVEANKDMHLEKKELHRFLRAYYHMKSADWEENAPYKLNAWDAENLAKMPEYYIMKLNKNMVESVMPHHPKNNCYDKWLNDRELEVYTNSFLENSFQPALNWYRCMTSNYINSDLRVFSDKKIEVPACFIAGTKDWGIYQKPGALDIMEQKLCSNYKGTYIIQNAGHWVQQENPQEVVKVLINFYNQNNSFQE